MRIIDDWRDASGIVVKHQQAHRKIVWGGGAPGGEKKSFTHSRNTSASCLGLDVTQQPPLLCFVLFMNANTDSFVAAGKRRAPFALSHDSVILRPSVFVCSHTSVERSEDVCTSSASTS